MTYNIALLIHNSIWNSPSKTSSSDSLMPLLLASSPKLSSLLKFDTASSEEMKSVSRTRYEHTYEYALQSTINFMTHLQIHHHQIR